MCYNTYMNYHQIYQNLIDRARRRAASKKVANQILGYSEAHHILPKCMGGTNEKTNIVHLSAREHFVAHLLLVKIYPLEQKLLYACHRLMYTKHNEERLCGRSYENLKKKLNEYQRTLNKNNCESVRRTSEKLTGRTKETHPYLIEAGKKMSLYRTGQTKENNESRKRASKNISKTQIGQTKENCERVRKTAEKLTGRLRENINILPKEIRQELVMKRNLGLTYLQLHEWVTNELGYTLSHRSISEIYKREVRHSSNFPS